MLESVYQGKLIPKIEALLPGCLIVKNDPNYIQGIPDLTIFYQDKWAFLEVKASEKSKERPNQRVYIEMWASWTFSSFIYPECEEYVLRMLHEYMVVGAHA